eukprot:CAMPEP_0174856766 /NCGR_PEP_ID=MMETSP1114-20130205/36207_1 /TAXON_ID=312471 /ORGANISM="Neobodo designis, Strain CCAP 1951/1" /LENGTH=94 /DNA_ID=CAMNT_0016091571 /DNA_START=220 /DNA_END=504 /DNA_ORIENTATION=+
MISPTEHASTPADSSRHSLEFERYRFFVTLKFSLRACEARASPKPSRDAQPSAPRSCTVGRRPTPASLSTLHPFSLFLSAVDGGRSGLEQKLRN